MEHIWDIEMDYHSNNAQPRSSPQQCGIINAVVKCEVQIWGHTFEGILETGASDSAVSHSDVELGVRSHGPNGTQQHHFPHC